MLFFWHHNLKKAPQADKRVLSSPKHLLHVCVPWVRAVLWLSTHYHEDSAAYHVEEDAATEKKLLLSVYKLLSAM